MSNDPQLDSVLLLEIHPANLLSFGPKTKARALEPRKGPPTVSSIPWQGRMSKGATLSLGTFAVRSAG